MSAAPGVGFTFTDDGDGTGAIDEILDISGNSVIMEQTTGASMPYYNLEFQNGMPGASFDGVQFMTSKVNYTMPASGNFCISMAVKTISDNTSDSTFSVDGAGANFDFQMSAGSATQYLNRTNTSGVGTSISPGTADYQSLTWANTAVFDWDSGTMHVYGNGVENTNGSQLYTAKLHSAQKLRLMANRNLGEMLEGVVFEVVAYEDPADRTTVEAYLNEKWVLY